MGGEQAEPPYKPRGEERRERGADHAHTEHAGGETAPRRLVPVVGERDADGEDRAGNAQEEPEKHQQRVGAHGCRDPDREHREDRRQRHRDEHGAPAEAVGERPGDDAAKGTHQDRGGDEQRRLGAGQ